MSDGERRTSHDLMADARRTLRRRALWVLLLVAVALAAPLLVPYDPDRQLDIVALNGRAPTAAHPFGTDTYSRDLLSRVIDGSRVSLALAAAAVTITLLVGTGYGALAAFAGGTVDRIMMRLLDVLLAIPRLLILLAVTALWDRLELSSLILLIGCTGWYDVARLVRAEAVGLLGRDFMLAAQAGGVGRFRMLVRHMMPHLLPVLAVSGTLGVANTIALEAGLSYLGLGVQPPRASWGTIMSDGAGLISTQWWMTVFPGLAVILAVLLCNALGDALRDVFATEQVPA